MSVDLEPHDVFVSYAREDSQWVRLNVYEPLRKCRTAQGRPPRIFFDVGEDGIQIGQDFQSVIDGAIEKMRKFVPIYSPVYFSKEMCRQELQLARSRDPNFQLQMLLPIMTDPKTEESVPFAFRRLNWLLISDPLWFKKLCQALDLRPTAEESSVTFVDRPRDVFANHTLPVLRVAVSGGPPGYEDAVTLRAERGQLLGTTTVKTNKDGVATFSDLSIADPVGETRLVARSAAFGEAASEPFSVISRAAVGGLPARADVAAPGAAASRVRLASAGETMFFEDGKHLAVVHPQRIALFAVDGRRIGDELPPLPGPIRLVRRRAGKLVLADWYGSVLVLDADGRTFRHDFASAKEGFCVPTDVDIRGDDVYVAFWNGGIFQIVPSGAIEPVLKDPDGVQVMGIFGDRLFTCDFSGNLRTYRNRRLTNTAAVEQTVWLLKDTPMGLVAVGDKKYYHLSPERDRVIDFDLPLAEVASVYELSDLPLVVDVHGKAIRFDADLVVNATVSTQPGAEPTSADHQGKFCVFANPDGTRTLLIHDRIEYSQVGGSLAVSPDGGLFAVGDDRTIELYPQAEFLELIRRDKRDAPPRSP